MNKRKRNADGKDVEPLLLTVPQVAALLGVGRTTVYNLINREGLPSVPLSGRGNVRIAKTSLEQWIEQREIRP